MSKKFENWFRKNWHYIAAVTAGLSVTAFLVSYLTYVLISKTSRRRFFSVSVSLRVLSQKIVHTKNRISYRTDTISERWRAKLKAMSKEKREKFLKAKEETSFNLPEISGLYASFMACADSSGRMGREEMKLILNHMKIEKKRDLDVMCHAWGLSSDHEKIDFLEFLRVWNRAMTDKVGFMFDCYDLDGGGTIGMDEIEQLLEFSNDVEMKETDKAKMKKSARAIYDALCNDEGWITRDAFIAHMEHDLWEETGPSQGVFNATGAPHIRRNSLDDLDFKLDENAQKIADEAAKSSACIPIGEGENCW